MILYECSAKVNINIEIGFKELIEKVLKRQEHLAKLDNQLIINGLNS